jgi:hypothetical protein
VPLEQSQNASVPLTLNAPGYFRKFGNTNVLQGAQTVYDDDLVVRGWKTRAAPVTVEPPQKEQSTVSEIETPKDAGIVRVPPSIIEVPREVKLQEWEGQIQEVHENHFTARLVDLTTRDTEETEEVELPISDIVEGDRDLVVPGAIFRWLIAYKYGDGEKVRFTRVIIRRLPMWTDAEIKEADREAAELHDALFGNSKNRTAEAI